MSYGFKRPGEDDGTGSTTPKLDFGGLKRDPVEVSPEKEAVALARGDAMGFVDRSQADRPGPDAGQGRVVRRRKEAVPSKNLYIKGPEELIDWFIELTNERGYRSYWQAIAEFRDLLNETRE